MSEVSEVSERGESGEVSFFAAAYCLVVVRAQSCDIEGQHTAHDAQITDKIHNFQQN